MMWLLIILVVKIQIESITLLFFRPSITITMINVILTIGWMEHNLNP